MISIKDLLIQRNGNDALKIAALEINKGRNSGCRRSEWSGEKHTPAGAGAFAHAGARRDHIPRKASQRLE